MDRYDEFLRAKIKMARFDGFSTDPSAVNPILFGHQRDIVRWAVKGGNRGIFASFGLGKSVMQCEWGRLTVAHAGGDLLLVAPLGVRQELIRDARMLGIDLQFIRTDAEVDPGHQFYLTNYESVRDGKLDPRRFTAVSLDEASVLRSFGSKTYQEFLPLSKGMTKAEYSAARQSLERAGIRARFPRLEDLQRGGIVGVAEVIACVPPERRTSFWHMPDCQGFALRNAQPLPFTPLAGRLGFFDVPADVLSEIIQNQ